MDWPGQATRHTVPLQSPPRPVPSPVDPGSVSVQVLTPRTQPSDKGRWDGHVHFQVPSVLALPSRASQVSDQPHSASHRARRWPQTPSRHQAEATFHLLWKQRAEEGPAICGCLGGLRLQADTKQKLFSIRSGSRGQKKAPLSVVV